MSKFDETLQTDQIDGAEFKFLGLEDIFERNKRLKFGRSILNFRSRFWILMSKIIFQTRIWISEAKFEILAALCFVFSLQFCSKFVQKQVVLHDFSSHLAVYPKIW